MKASATMGIGEVRLEKIRAPDLVEGGLTCDYEDITECPTYQSLVAGRIGPHAP